MSNMNLDQEILSLLPSVGSDFLSTTDIHAKLKRMGAHKPVSDRTVLRAMERLLDTGMVEAEKRGVSFYWRRVAGASGFKLGAMMTHDEALALQTLRRFAARQIPRMVTESLSGLFDVARSRLDGAADERGKRYRKWEDKVDVVSSGFALIPPPIDQKVFDAVTQALFCERKLEAAYHARSNTIKTEPRVLMPLGLVEMNGLVYLVAGMEKHQNPAIYRLDRLRQAHMLDESFSYPRMFHLSDYVKAQRQFDFMVEKEIRLVLRFTNNAGDHLLESPLSKDQQIKRTDQWLEVLGTVLLSQRLRWWLRAFGPNVEVIKPASLRAEMRQEAALLSKAYGRSV